MWLTSRQSQNNKHTESTHGWAAHVELKWHWTERTEDKGKQAWCKHQEHKGSFQQVANSYYEWMTSKTIQALSRKQYHCFHLKKWATKASTSKQHWSVSWRTQELPYWKGKTGSDTLVTHASLKIKSACTNKLYIAKAVSQRQFPPPSYFQGIENSAGLCCHRRTAHIQWLHCKSFIMWLSGHAIGNSVFPKHLRLMELS